MTDISKQINPLKDGTRSKLVRSFLERHKLVNVELPSTGSFAKDMMLKLAIHQEKMEAMKIAIEVLKSQDQRALTLYSMLIEINLLLAHYENTKSPEELVQDQNYHKWMQTKLEILKHYERMKFDLEKIKVENKIKNMTRVGDDTLFVMEMDK